MDTVNKPILVGISTGDKNIRRVQVQGDNPQQDILDWQEGLKSLTAYMRSLNPTTVHVYDRKVVFGKNMGPNCILWYL